MIKIFDISLMPKSEVTIDDFDKRCPQEASILKGLDITDIEIFIDQDQKMFIRTNDQSLSFDLKSKLDYHTKFFYKNSIYKEPLAKALGIKKSQSKPRVFDASAGVMSDTCLIHSFGCEIVAVERQPVVAALIVNALRFVDMKLNFYHQSAIKEVFDCDVAYFDPMYKITNKKSAPKKEMQIFRQIVGADDDALGVAKFLRQNYKRLVIKRSIKAKPLLEKPDHSYLGKSTAYDMYISIDKADKAR